MATWEFEIRNEIGVAVNKGKVTFLDKTCPHCRKEQRHAPLYIRQWEETFLSFVFGRTRVCVVKCVRCERVSEEKESPDRALVDWYEKHGFKTKSNVRGA